jgi:hypothetical protein
MRGWILSKTKTSILVLLQTDIPDSKITSGELSFYCVLLIEDLLKPLNRTQRQPRHILPLPPVRGHLLVRRRRDRPEILLNRQPDHCRKHGYRQQRPDHLELDRAQAP